MLTIRVIPYKFDPSRYAHDSATVQNTVMLNSIAITQLSKKDNDILLPVGVLPVWDVSIVDTRQPGEKNHTPVSEHLQSAITLLPVAFFQLTVLKRLRIAIVLRIRNVNSGSRFLIILSRSCLSIFKPKIVT